MQNSGKVKVCRAARTAAKGRLRFEDLHFQPSTGADYGRGEPVGTAADDGDVHRSITAETLAYSLVG